MAHFSKIVDNKVTDLIVINNSDCGGGEYPESEPIGQAFIAALSLNSERLQGYWLQTSYNTHNGLHYDNPPVYSVMLNGEIETNGNSEKGFRFNFGLIGMTYDPVLDEFVSPVVEP